MITQQALARSILLLGLPLLSVCCTAFDLRLKQLPRNPRPTKESPVLLPSGAIFKSVDKLAKQQHYLAAGERLQRIPKTDPQYGAASAIKSQYQQKAIQTLRACSHGFEPEALERSSFYKTAQGQYIAQIECSLGATQPAYEYYLYNESALSPQVKPLPLTQFEPTVHRVRETDSNFITGSPAFNRQTQELVVARQYGEKGDCGTLGAYKFAQNELVLEHFLADFQCGDGKLRYQQLLAHAKP